MKELTSFSSSSLTQSNIVRVRFPNALGDFYFGSLAVIYEIFTPDEIGAELQTLYSLRLVPDGFSFTTPAGVEVCKLKFYRKKQGVSK